MIPQPKAWGSRPLRYIPALIAALYLVFAITSVQYDDTTTDEGRHLQYGIALLKGNAGRYREGAIVHNSTMPVTVLNALPRAAEQLMHPGTRKTDWGVSDIKRGRYITILATLLLLFYCYRFAAMLSSAPTACLVMLLVAADPNILAHSRLVTTDIYASTAFIATLYHLWRWLVQQQPRHFYYWCIAIALAQVCKVNNILLYPACLIPILVYRLQKGAPAFPWRAFLQGFLVFALIQIAIINSAFLFSSGWSSLGALSFKSNFFNTLRSSWIAHIPLPLPKAYIDTFDLIQYERESFIGSPLNYLNGQLRYKQGFWNYYLVCYALKTPLLNMAITLAGLVYCCVVKKIRAAALLFGWIPVLLVLLFLSTSSIQSGYRYLPPATCLALIFSACLLESLLARLQWIALGAMTVIAIITAVIAFPNYIAYTNRFITDKKTAYRYFADSNLDWGQRHEAVQEFLRRHPGYIFAPATPVTGTVVIDINRLVGIKDSQQFEWIRKNYSPVATFDDCYLIYDIRALPFAP